MLKTLTTLMVLVAINCNANLVTFDDLSLAPDSFFNPQSNTSFSSGGLTFSHVWEFDCCWGGTAYSNRTDTTTPTFTNQYSAITGDGANTGQDNYAIVTNPFSVPYSWQFGGLTVIESFEITNTTFAYLAMRDGVPGDSFGFEAFDEGDFFEVVFNGLDSLGNTISSHTVRLADNNELLDTWEYIDISGLGAIHGIAFDFISSKNNSGGNLVPAYFAVDNIEYRAVPLPASGYLFGLTLATLLHRKIRKASLVFRL